MHRQFGTGNSALRLHDHGRICNITTRWSGNAVEVGLEPLERPFVVLRACAAPQPAAAVFTGADGRSRELTVARDGNAWTMRAPATGGRVLVRLTSCA